MNERALDLCRGQRRRGRARATSRSSTPDEVPDDLAVDLHLVEPADPHRQAALHELLAPGSAGSTPDGRAVLVVQKHLGADSLQRWLDAEGWAATRLGSRAGYRAARGDAAA